MLRLALLAVCSAGGARAAFQPNSLIVLRVGDGVTPLLSAGAVPAARASPVFLDNYDPAFAATPLNAGSSAVAGVVVAGNDYSMGSLTLAGNGGSATFGGVSAAPGLLTPLACGTLAPGSCFSSLNRVVGSVSWDGTVAVVASLNSTLFDGSVKGVCSVDGAGFYVVGNSSAGGAGIVYVPAGGTSKDATVLYRVVAGSPPLHGCAAALDKTLYLARSTNVPYLDKFLNAPTTGSGAMQGLTSAPATLNGAPYHGKQAITNFAQTRVWASVVSGIGATDGGIFTSAAPTASGSSVTGLTNMFLNTAAANTFRVTGLALSADETTLYFTARQPLHALYSVSAACLAACTPVLVALAPNGTEFRGVSLAPQYPRTGSASPTPTRSSLPSPTASSSPLPSLAPGASQYPPLWGASNLVLLRVGDGSGNALSADAAQVVLEEVDPAAPAASMLKRELRIAGATLSGTDWMQGGLSRTPDASALLFGALYALDVSGNVGATVGTVPSGAAPFFTAERAIVKVGLAGDVVISDTINPPALGGGMLRGVCETDPGSYIITANGTAFSLAFVDAGTEFADVNALRAGDTLDFVACYVAPQSKGSTFLLRSCASCGGYSFVDQVAPQLLPPYSYGPLTFPANGFASGSPYYAKSLVANSAETQVWVGYVADSGANANNGIYTGGAPWTNMAALTAGTFAVTGLALSPNEATLFFTARLPAHALYSVSPQLCTPGPCVPVLLRAAGAGIEYRGLANAPRVAWPTPSPSPTTSTTPSTSPTISGSRTQTPSVTPPVGTTPTPSPSPVTVASYATGRLLVLRVGDGVSPLTENAAPISLDEYNPALPLPLASLSSAAINGATISGTDYFQGTLTRSGDGSTVMVGAVGAAVGAAPICAAPPCLTSASPPTRPFFAEDRVIVAMGVSGAISTSTRMSAAVYDGIIRGVCALNGTGFWVVGNVSDGGPGVAYVPANSFNTAGSSSVVQQYFISLEDFTGCAVTFSPNLYLLRSTDYVYADVVTQPSTTGVLPNFVPTLSAIASPPYMAKSLITNAAESRFWVGIISGYSATDGGIWSGTSLTGMVNIVDTRFRVTGMALSADETTLFFTAREPQHALYSFPASCTSPCTTGIYCPIGACVCVCAPVLVALAPNGTEFRGVSLAPTLARPSPSPTPSRRPAASPTPTPSRTPFFPAPSAAPAAPSIAQPFGASNLLLLRVGAGGTTALSSAAAPLFLDELSPGPAGAYTAAAASLVKSYSVAGVTISGSDPDTGSLALSADGAFAFVGGVDATPGTASGCPENAHSSFVGGAAQCFASSRRVVTRVAPDGSQLPVASLVTSQFNGIIKGLCSYDGSSVLVLGNATGLGVGFISASAAAAGAGPAGRISPNFRLAQLPLLFTVTGFITGTKLTLPFGGQTISVGAVLSGVGVLAGTTVTSVDNSVAFPPTYVVSPSQAVGSASLPVAISVGLDARSPGLFTACSFVAGSPNTLVALSGFEGDPAAGTVSRTGYELTWSSPLVASGGALPTLLAVPQLYAGGGIFQDVYPVQPSALLADPLGTQPGGSGAFWYYADGSTGVAFPKAPYRQGGCIFKDVGNALSPGIATSYVMVSGVGGVLGLALSPPLTAQAAGGAFVFGADGAPAGVTFTLFAVTRTALWAMPASCGPPGGLACVPWALAQAAPNTEFRGVAMAPRAPPCPTGFVATPGGEKACTAVVAPAGPCVAGLGYLSGGVCVACSRCQPGSRVAQACTPTSNTVCALCPADTYAGAADSAACAPCPENSFTDGAAGLSTCVCKAGFAFNGGAGATLRCNACAPGSYNTADRAAANLFCLTCSACAAPSSWTASPCSATTDSVCRPCPSGSVTSSGAQDTCHCYAAGFTVPYGQQGFGASLKCCPDGAAWVGQGAQGQCVCRPGYTSAASGLPSVVGSSLTCTACGPNTYINAAGACVACPGASTSAGNGATSCTCPANTFSAGSGPSLTCTPCPAYSTSAAGATACTCNAAAQGAVWAAATGCVCGNGYFSNYTGAPTGIVRSPAPVPLVCRPCRAGAYTPLSFPDSFFFDICVPVPQGFFAPAIASPFPTPCASGSSSLAGAVGCTCNDPNAIWADNACVCPPAFTSTGAGLCGACAAGHYQNGTAAGSPYLTCVPCPADTYSTAPPAGPLDVCTPCPAGTTTAGARGQRTCSFCSAPNSYVSGVGALATCTACATGSVGAAATGSVRVWGPGGALSLLPAAAALTSSQCVCSDPTATWAANGTAANACTCPAGYAQTGPACALCAPGTFSAAAGNPFCLPCPANSFSPPGATACVPCAAGSVPAPGGGGCVSNITATAPMAIWVRAQNLMQCPLGYSPLGGGATLTCPNCAAGYSASGSGASLACSPCAMNTFNALVSATSTCLACPANSYTNLNTAQSVCVCQPSFIGAAGSPPCTACPPGSTAAWANACQCADKAATWTAAGGCTCQSGFSQAGDGKAAPAVCSLCPAGTFAAAGATSCSQCAANQYSLASASSCTNCAPGLTSLPGSAVCKCEDPNANWDILSNTCSCAAGFAQSGFGTSGVTCQACAVGTFSFAGAPQCSPCPANSVYSATAGTCVCALGAVRTAGAGFAIACTKCAMGFYSSNSSATSCTACPAGQTGPAGAALASQCAACPPGTNATGTLPGAGTCACAAGGAVFNGTACNCPAGTYLSGAGASQQCRACIAGTYSQLYDKACTACLGSAAPGQVDPDPQATRLSSCRCAAGFFWPRPEDGGSRACVACPAGATSFNGNHNGTCFCRSGFFPQAGTTGSGLVCRSCDAGGGPKDGCLCKPNFYVEGAGDFRVCATCPAGSSSAGGLVAACTACPAGTTSVPGGPCTTCAAGTYAAAGATTCAPCPAGQRSAAGATVCAVCPVGVAYSSVGALPAQATCACAAGYGWSLASNACVACGGGSNSTAPGYAGCTSCPASASSAGGSASWSSATNACQCNAGFTSLMQTAGAGLVCLPCSAACAVGFKTGECSPTNDIGCSLYTDCPAGFKVVAAGTATSDRVCAPCNTAAGEFSNAKNSASCSVCAAGSTADPTTNGAACKCAAAGAVWGVPLNFFDLPGTPPFVNECHCPRGAVETGSGASLACSACGGPAASPCPATATATASPTPSQTGTPTRSATPTPSQTGTVSSTISASKSLAATPSITVSISVTASNTKSISITPTPTTTLTRGASASVPAASVSGSPTPTPTATLSVGASPSVTPTKSGSGLPSASPSVSGTPPPASATGTGSGLGTRSNTRTRTPRPDTNLNGDGGVAPPPPAAKGGISDGVAVVIALAVAGAVGIAAFFYVRNAANGKFGRRGSRRASSGFGEAVVVTPSAYKGPASSRSLRVGGAGAGSSPRALDFDGNGGGALTSVNPLGAAAAAAAAGGARGQQKLAFQPATVGGGGGGGPAAAVSTWTECTDIASGSRWYFNAATGATVWALPEGGVIGQRMAR